MIILPRTYATVPKKWYGSHEIERELGYDNGYIIKCCKGYIKRAYGYVWKYGKRD